MSVRGRHRLNGVLQQTETPLQRYHAAKPLFSHNLRGLWASHGQKCLGQLERSGLCVFGVPQI